MKKINVLLCLGVFLVTAGVLSRVYVYPSLAVVPDDLDTSVVTANPENEPASFFSIAELSEKQGRLKNSTVARIDTEASARATKQVGRETQVVVLKDCTDLATLNCAKQKYPLSASNQTIAIDAKTGAAAPWTGNSIETGGETTSDIPIKGYTIKLPFGVEKKSYQMWNFDLNRTIAAQFQGEDTVKGLRVFRFETVVPTTVINTLELPGSLVGSSEASVSAEQVTTSKTTFLVEPETGVIMDAVSSQDGYARVDGKRALTLIKGTFVGDDATVTQTVEEYTSLSQQLFLLRVILPMAGSIGGLLLVGLASAMALARRRRGLPSRATRDASRSPSAVTAAS